VILRGSLWVILCLPAVAAAQGYQGTGRITLMPSFRLSQQSPFYASAAAAGYSAPGGLDGGPGAIGSFAYAATENLEVAVDPFFATEQLTVNGIPPVRAYVYGVNLGLRIVAPLAGNTFYPWLGLHSGPVLVYAGGPPNVASAESFGQTFGASLGLGWRFSERWGAAVQYQFMYGGELKTSVGTILGRGHWFSAGVTYYFAKDSSEYPSH